MPRVLVYEGELMRRVKSQHLPEQIVRVHQHPTAVLAEVAKHYPDPHGSTERGLRAAKSLAR